ncbi:MAG: hypothetical protein FWD82_05050 [Defluviitaleaceae bacterium]|nr:hypothetical protein [Defluviitaleaceae bacterium]
MKARYRIISFGIGIAIGVVFNFLIAISVDIFRYSLTARSVDLKMSEMEVVSFADVQGSRVYVVVKRDSYKAYIYETSIILPNRFNLMAEFEPRKFLFDDGVYRNSTTLVFGRWERFWIEIDGLDIIYVSLNENEDRNHSRIIEWRRLGFIFAVGSPSSSLVYLYFFKKRIE